MARSSGPNWVFSNRLIRALPLRFNRRPGNLFLAVVLFPVLVTGTAVADTVSVRPGADATLFEVNPDNSAGGANFFNSGTTQNFTRNRGLLYFDIASALPPGAQITGVGLQLEVVRRPADGFEPALFGLHRMLRPWGEGTSVPFNNPGGLGTPADPGDATWLHRFATSETWAEPGGASDVDFSALVSSASFVYGVGAYQFEGTQDMINDVQSWLDQPQLNFGWMLLCQNEEQAFTARRFASREDLDRAPLLTIDFIVVPEPGVWAFGVLGLAAAVACRRRRASI